MKEQPSYYAILTADVRYDKELSSSEKIFFAEITALSQKNGECWASNSYFSNLYGVETRTITRWVKKLQQRGYIESKLIYSEDGKSIDKRVITLSTKMSEGYRHLSQEGIDKNVADNNTSNNTTRENNNNKEIDSKEWFSNVPTEGLENFSWQHFTRNYNATKGRRTRWEDVYLAGERFRDLQTAEGAEKKIYKEWCKHFQNWLKFRDLPNAQRVSL